MPLKDSKLNYQFYKINTFPPSNHFVLYAPFKVSTQIYHGERCREVFNIRLHFNDYILGGRTKAIPKHLYT